MNIQLRQRLSVMLDLAMHVAGEARCLCPHQTVEESRRFDPSSGEVFYQGHIADCDVQVASNVLHTSARLLNMKEDEREATVAALRKRLGVS